MLRNLVVAAFFSVIPAIAFGQTSGSSAACPPGANCPADAPTPQTRLDGSAGESFLSQLLGGMTSDRGRTNVGEIYNADGTINRSAVDARSRSMSFQQLDPAMSQLPALFGGLDGIASLLGGGEQGMGSLPGGVDPAIGSLLGALAGGQFLGSGSRAPATRSLFDVLNLVQGLGASDRESATPPHEADTAPAIGVGRGAPLGEAQSLVNALRQPGTVVPVVVPPAPSASVLPPSLAELAEKARKEREATTQKPRK